MFGTKTNKYIYCHDIDLCMLDFFSYGKIDIFFTILQQ